MIISAIFCLLCWKADSSSLFHSDDDFDMNLQEPNPLQEEHEDLQQLQTDIEENDNVSYFSIQKPTHVSNKTTELV